MNTGMILLPIRNFFILLTFIFFSINGFSQRGKIPPLINSVKYVSSSIMPPSYGYYYTPSMAGDNSLFTWWSPAIWDRETCWLQISYNSPRTLSYIQIHAGSHYPNFKNLGNLYPKNLRIRVAHLEFSDGTIRRIELSDADEIQTIYFPGVFSSFIRIRPLEYYPATKWNDPCISYFVAGN